MGVENNIFWSEKGAGFGEPGSTPPPRIPRSILPPPPPPTKENNNITNTSSLCFSVDAKCHAGQTSRKRI